MTISNPLSRTLKPKLRLRNLDEEELGPGYDEDRQNQEIDDADGYENEVIQERAQTILDVGIGRHAIPKPSDGEVRGCECTLNMSLIKGCL